MLTAEIHSNHSIFNRRHFRRHFDVNINQRSFCMMFSNTGIAMCVSTYTTHYITVCHSTFFLSSLVKGLKLKLQFTKFDLCLLSVSTCANTHYNCILCKIYKVVLLEIFNEYLCKDALTGDSLYLIG